MLFYSSNHQNENQVVKKGIWINKWERRAEVGSNALTRMPTKRRKTKRENLVPHRTTYFKCLSRAFVILQPLLFIYGSNLVNSNGKGPFGFEIFDFYPTVSCWLVTAAKVLVKPSNTCTAYNVCGSFFPETWTKQTGVLILLKLIINHWD